MVLFLELGYGLPEKVYQQALEEELKTNKIQYCREKYGAITYKNQRIGKYFIDFLIEHRVAVELKVRNEIYQDHINQLLNYLKSEKLKVGLLLAISKNGILIKRIVN